MIWIRSVDCNDEQYECESGIDVTSGVFLLCQAVLKKRDNVQAEYEAKLEAAALRKEERPTAKVSLVNTQRAFAKSSALYREIGGHFEIHRSLQQCF